MALDYRNPDVLYAASTIWPTGRSHAYPDRSCAYRRTRLSGRTVAAFYISRQIQPLEASQYHITPLI